MIPLWVLKTAAVAIVLAVLAGSLHLWGQSRYEAGKTAERELWAAREAKELAAANTRILELTEQARAKEAANATALAAVAARYEQEKRRVIDQAATDIVAVRAGAIVLRDPGATAACQGAGPSGTSPSATAANVSDGAARPGLSSEATQFLLGLANDADAVVAQLTAAQAVIREQQRACGLPEVPG